MLVARKLFLACLQSGKHGNDDRDVFRPRTLAAFLFTADNQRGNMTAPGNFQKADAAWPAEFVRRPAEKIAFAQPLRGHFSDPLYRVAEKRHLVLLANGQDFAP